MTESLSGEQEGKKELLDSEIYTETAMSWSDLPLELLADITNRLDVADVVRSSTVCVWWRNGICREHYSKSNIPWMMLSSPNEDNVEYRFFYSLTENKLYKFHLPEIARQHCVGSSQGYLFSVDDNADLIATNPLIRGGGVRLPLPPTSALPDVVAVVRDDTSGRVVEYEVINIMTDDPDDPDENETLTVKHMHDYHNRKVILSPGVDTAVVIHGSDDWLAFLRVGDRSWTGLKTPPTVREFDDMIFHRGRLHAINFMGTLAIFDLDCPYDPPFVSPRGPLKDKDGAARRYLVESPDGDSLFLVLKEYVYKNSIPVTNNFIVYLLDKATYMWKPIKNLGEVSLFLGFNHSLALCTRGCNLIKKNCIYFIDDYKDWYIVQPEAAGDKGIFSLDEGSVERLDSDDKLDLFNWPPPIWFVPILHLHRGS